MKLSVINFANEAVGEIDLDDAVFGLPARPDLLSRAVNWQRAKARQGSHKVKTISEISGTGKKPFRQKGTGRARQGSMRSTQFRGGQTVFGPVVRSHAIDMNKKVRRLALKTALSVKAAEGKLIVVDEAKPETHKTKAMAEALLKIGAGKSALIIDGAAVDEACVRAVRNLPLVQVLPQIGANVYDILKRDTLVLTRAAVESLEARLK